MRITRYKLKILKIFMDENRSLTGYYIHKNYGYWLGTLYLALYTLEDNGYLSSIRVLSPDRNDNGRVYYAITEKGKLFFKQHEERILSVTPD